MSFIVKGIDIPPNSKVQIIVESPTESFRKQMPKSRIIQIPKGHGDIKDIDQITKLLPKIYLGGISHMVINDAPTILESEE